MTASHDTRAHRKAYRKPAAPKLVGSVDASANSYYFGGADFGLYTSGVPT